MAHGILVLGRIVHLITHRRSPPVLRAVMPSPDRHLLDLEDGSNQLATQRVGEGGG